MSILDDPGLFGRQWAATYDDPGNPDPALAVEFLAGLAAGGPVLELAIGSGRVALPLAERGIPVEGIEASPEMVALMRAKPGGERDPGRHRRYGRRGRDRPVPRWSIWSSTRCST